MNWSKTLCMLCRLSWILIRMLGSLILLLRPLAWMDGKTVNLRLHYEGKFKKTSYVGGKHFIVMGLDVESFSYSVLMELVKDNVHFTEIGGIYPNKGRNGGWQLLSNDKQVMALVEDCAPGYLVNFYIDNIVDKKIEPAPQMQPHVITRPRENFIQASHEKPLKRKFVTTHKLQQQKKKMDKKLLGVGGWQDILTKESGQDVPVRENEKVTVRRKLALEPCVGDVEDTGHKDVAEKLPPPPPLSEYLKFKKACCRGDSEDTRMDVAEKLPPPSSLPMFLKRNMEKVKKARCRGVVDKMVLFSYYHFF
ncbi:uncharacterized protein LOC141724193 isoform X1 [Apium graveolens]|uniref:uncharacterized protein LOC141724193 isoform X1 n=1 Tax=Apium graveolens TaxID=4045 RepID=UPI003D78B8D1